MVCSTIFLLLCSLSLSLFSQEIAQDCNIDKTAATRSLCTRKRCRSAIEKLDNLLVRNRLRVQGKAELCQNASVCGDLSVAGAIAAGIIRTNNLIAVAGTELNGDVTIGCQDGNSSLTVCTETNFTDNVSIGCAPGSTGQVQICSPVTFEGPVVFNNNVDISCPNTLTVCNETVTGDLTVDGDVIINGQVDFTGNISIGCTGPGGTFTVCDPTIFNNDVTVNGTTTLCGSTRIDGNIALGCNPAGGCPASLITVCAPVVFDDSVTINCPNTLTVCNEIVTGNLTVNGEVIINGPIDFTGDTSIGCTGPGGTFTVCDPTVFNNNVTIPCPSTFEVCNEIVDNSLTVNGNTALCGNITIDGTIAVGCSPSANCPTTTVTACAPFTFNDNVTINCPANLTACDTTINGALSVDGTTIISAPVFITGGTAFLEVNGEGRFDSNVVFNTIGVDLLAAGSTELVPMRIIRGVVDTATGNAFAGANFGFTSVLGSGPGEVVITFTPPFAIFSRPVAAVTPEDFSGLPFFGMVAINTLTPTGFTLRTYDTAGVLSPTTANFIVVGSA
jgi:cytoskeletal protein CcmA (bactofilin family)